MTRIALLAILLLLAAAPAASASSLVEVPLSGPQSVAVLERLGLPADQLARASRWAPADPDPSNATEMNRV